MRSTSAVAVGGLMTRWSDGPMGESGFMGPVGLQ